MDNNTLLIILGLAGLGAAGYFFLGNSDEDSNSNTNDPMAATYTSQTANGQTATATGYQLRAMGYVLTPAGWVTPQTYQNAQNQGGGQGSFDWVAFLNGAGGLLQVVGSTLGNWNQTQTGQLNTGNTGNTGNPNCNSLVLSPEQREAMGCN